MAFVGERLKSHVTDPCTNECCATDGGNQQYTVRNFEISRQIDSCIALIWDWGWTWVGLFLSDAPNGFSLINPETNGAEVTPTGSIYVMDSAFARVTSAIKTALMKKDVMDTTLITLDNIGIEDDVGTLISFTDGTVLDVPAGNIDHIVVGNIKIGDQSFGEYR